MLNAISKYDSKYKKEVPYPINACKAVEKIPDSLHISAKSWSFQTCHPID